MQAEMALIQGNTGAAQAFLEAGTAKSIAKARSFGSLDSSADLSKAPELGDDDLYIQRWVSFLQLPTIMARWISWVASILYRIRKWY